MIQVEKFLSETLASLPSSHPDREKIVGMLEDARLHNTQKGVEETPLNQLDLEAVWLRQVGILADLFAGQLGQSKDQYMDSLPKFGPSPIDYEVKFGPPVIVQVPQGKLTFAKMLEIQVVTNYLPNLKDLKDWQKDPQKFKTPNRPYVTYLHDGSRNLNRSPRDVRLSLISDERGGTVFDGLALLAQNPGILKHHYLDLPGSQYGSGGVPCLVGWGGGPGLDGCDWVGFAGPGFGSVVAGRNVVTK